jgi:hypothetical protein
MTQVIEELIDSLLEEEFGRLEYLRRDSDSSQR